MKYLSCYPHTKRFDGKLFFRTTGTGGLHDHSSKAKREQEIYKRKYYTRLFWTGGQRLSDGTIRKSFFILISPKA